VANGGSLELTSVLSGVGGPQPLAILPGRHLSFEHGYTRPGKYRVTVTVVDDDGGLTTDTFLVIVLPPR
jgi:hypothetical protein